MMRKADYAACVRRIAPHYDGRTERMCINIRICPVSCAHTVFDTLPIEAYLYLRSARTVHGESKKVGPEDRGTSAGWRAQPPSRRRPRCRVHRQSILRSERPGPGALRDGAAPSSRRRRHQRCRDGLRGVPANLLQSPGCLGDGRACRSATEPAGAQRRPQNLRRGDCLRRRTQGREPRADDATMSRCDRGALRRQGASTQPRTRAGAQKKRINPP